MIFTKESTHYYIISNIWIATAILADHAHDAWFAGLFGLLWFFYGVIISRKEKESDDIDNWG